MNTELNLVLTRSALENRALQESLNKLLPSLSIFQVNTIEYSYKIMKPIELEKYNLLIFTSKNSVISLSRYLKETEQTVAGHFIAAVGDGTASACITYLNKEADLVSTENSALSLSYDIQKRFPKDCKMLFLKGNLSLSVITDELLSKGYPLDELEVYQNNKVTKLSPDIAKIKSINPKDLIYLILSPSAFYRVLDLIDASFLARGKFICLGKTSKEAILNELDSASVSLLLDYKNQSLENCLCDHLAKI